MSLSLTFSLDGSRWLSECARWFCVALFLLFVGFPFVATIRRNRNPESASRLPTSSVLVRAVRASVIPFIIVAVIMWMYTLKMGASSIEVFDEAIRVNYRLPGRDLVIAPKDVVRVEVEETPWVRRGIPRDRAVLVLHQRDGRAIRVHPEGPGAWEREQIKRCAAYLKMHIAARGR